MNVLKNAPLMPKGREAMVRSVVEGGARPTQPAGSIYEAQNDRQVPPSRCWSAGPVAGAARLGRPSFRFGLRMRRPPEFPGFGTRDGPRRPLKRRFRK